MHYINQHLLVSSMVTSYLALTGELWACIVSFCYRQKWPRNNGTALYFTWIVWFRKYQNACCHWKLLCPDRGNNLVLFCEVTQMFSTDGLVPLCLIYYPGEYWMPSLAPIPRCIVCLQKIRFDFIGIFANWASSLFTLSMYCTILLFTSETSLYGLERMLSRCLLKSPVSRLFAQPFV